MKILNLNDFKKRLSAIYSEDGLILNLHENDILDLREISEISSFITNFEEEIIIKSKIDTNLSFLLNMFMVNIQCHLIYHFNNNDQGLIKNLTKLTIKDLENILRVVNIINSNTFNIYEIGKDAGVLLNCNEFIALLIIICSENGISTYLNSNNVLDVSFIVKIYDFLDKFESAFTNKLKNDIQLTLIFNKFILYIEKWLLSALSSNGNFITDNYSQDTLESLIYIILIAVNINRNLLEYYLENN